MSGSRGAAALGGVLGGAMRWASGVAASTSRGTVGKGVNFPSVPLSAQKATGGGLGLVGGAAATAAARAAGRRYMAYFSGSHYEMDHMIGAKNPQLPKDEKLAQAAVTIFGTAATSNPHQRSVRKLLLKPLRGPRVIDYYPEWLKHNQNGYRSPHKVRQEEKLKRFKMQGRGPPKKGMGKRASKKK